MPDPLTIWHYVCARLGTMGRRDDRGVVTTEFAVIAFLVVTGAIVVTGLVMAAATRNAESIPNP